MATANAVRFVGAEVWFADVDPVTGLMTKDTVREAYAGAVRSGKSVKAIYNVHLNGQVSDSIEIYEFAKHHGLFVVDDASHAIGSAIRVDGKFQKVGSCKFSDMTTFSFHPVKTIAMGEGGAITTKEQEVYEKLSRLRNHGITRDPRDFKNKYNAYAPSGKAHPWYYEMHSLGFNYRVSDISCALGLSQLKKLKRSCGAERKLYRGR